MIHIYSTYDIDTGRLLEYVADPLYSGPVALCKGDNTARAAEAQQASFDKQLMSIFSQQFAQQSDIFNFLKGKLEPMIDHPTGYSDEALAAMRTGATEGITTQFDNAQRAIQGQQFALGGRDLPSGVNEMEFGALKSAEAGKEADTQNQITLANENMKQSNYWNAMNALNGQEALLNPTGYANAATSGSNAVAGLSNAVTSSQGPGLMGLFGSLAGAGATAFGASQCWVAAELYGGWNDPRTEKVRGYIGYKAQRGIKWPLFSLVYTVFGKLAAIVVKHCPAARWLAHQLFDRILAAASASENWKP